MSYIVKAIIPIIILLIIAYGMAKKVKVYECFVEGAKDGVSICIKIFPYLLAMMVAIAVFRESKALDRLINILRPVSNLIGLPGELVPLVLIKPLSGSGALGVFADILKQFGPDSNVGKMASIIMGSTETIFYTITVYFGAVGIKKIRHTLWAAIFADMVAIIMAILVTNMILL
ncbi:spore maturation protein [Clostridium sporogenes]|uniref:spore maturation protein n=1 Tax=Clostridium sp. LCP25S3_F8 TaxID=3438751 RepID=UPI0013D15020|nr:spore maturation protein [Clostridium sporogenes]NFS24109.1 spore maturation protein [Clostridium sporogenes]